ncbi:MAG TPA: C40 family peptidase [Acidimicrobiales bacterium]|nr:C40 family peptidase [Acidimicrobiales bacterium]
MVVAGPAVVVAVSVSVSAPPAAADQLAQARAQAAQIVAQIQAQGNRLAALSEQYDQAQLHVAQLDAQVAATQAQIGAAQVRVAGDRAQLRTQAVQEYTSGGSTSGLEDLFAPGDVGVLAQQEYERDASGDVAGAIDQLDHSESVLETQEAALRATQAQAAAALAAARAARQGAQAELADQQATLAQVRGQIATLVAQKQAAEQAAQEAAFQAQVVAAQQDASPQADPPPAPGGGGGRAVAAAESQIGVPYVWGGASPGHAFDCSGLTMWAWGQAGVGLTHSAAAQYDEIVHVPLSDLQPGDLLFYDEGGTIGHVTMYVGGGQMVQAMETGTLVQITGVWTTGLVGAGRP